MRRAEGLVPYALLLVIALGLVGCGVTATGEPVDEGDAAAAGPGSVDAERVDPPGPDAAAQPMDLVRNFFLAAAGGGPQANEHVKQYLTGTAEDAWTDPPNVDNPQLTVVRLVGGPAAGIVVSGRGTQVTVEYEPVGVLTDRGRVDELAANLEQRSLTFWVVTSDEEFTIRIGEIEGWPPGLLLLSDQALTQYYRIQPIYFWDTEYTALVPDLRYVPLTIAPNRRREQRLTWLAEPSPWLAGSVQSLPAGTTSSEPPVLDEGRLRVNLSAPASALAGDQEAARRLMIQLQWSLADGESPPQIDLFIDNQPIRVDIDDDDLRAARLTLSYQRGAGRYDITNGAVRAVPPSPPPGSFSVPENTGVVAAAVRSEPEAAVLVRDVGSGPRVLQIVSGGASRPIDLQLSINASLGRPSFVPRTGLVVLPTGGPNGRLVAVAIDTGATSDVTGSRLPGVSAAAVSPDGRRIALIAGNELYVAPLNLANGTIAVGSVTRQLLAGQLAATAVTWTAESWLLVAGVREDERPTLWRVTADGVVARDLSSSLGNDLRVDDLVSWPNWRNTQDGETEVWARTNFGVYTFRSNQFSPQAELTAPFFG